MSACIRRSLAALFAATAALAVPGCSPPRSSSSAGGSSGSASASDSAARVEVDSVRIARLEREARALAKTDGCARSEQCRTAPVGHRACGGPRTYLAYCARTTDSTALFAKLGELARAEEAAQRREGVVSTCLMRLPPTVSLGAGRCVTVPTDSGGTGGAP